MNKKILTVILVVIAISIAGTVVLNYGLFARSGMPPSGTLMFQSDVAGVTVTILGPNETLRTGVVGENFQLSFTGLLDGNYTAIATKDGYNPSDMYGNSIRNGGMTTVPFSMNAIPSRQPLQLSTNPSAIIIKQGSSGTVTFNVTSLNDYAGAVSFSFDSYCQYLGAMSGGLPSGVTASFDPASVTVTAGGQASSILTLTVSSTATKGVYTMFVEISYEQGGIEGVGLLLQVS
jgi:hypothetical protein